MDFVIISGLSGAGKSRASRTLEDIGFYCVDNMPVDLIPQFAQICLATKGRYERVALVTDVRGSLTFDGLFRALDRLDAMKCEYTILFFEASTEVLISRFKETRRMHPLMRDGSTLLQAVERERQLLEPVRNRAAYIIDTSTLTAGKLRCEMIRLFEGSVAREHSMAVKIISFGFKFGLPMDADLVFDVRFLPNPYYIEEMRHKTGLDQDVRDFVFSYQQTKDYVGKLEDLLAFSLPLHMEEGKTNLTIAVGCTGGQHRSVAIAKELGEFVSKRGFATAVSHRDMGRR
ncbi:MAG: RNase adapter RapZ [Oscillospiraceae bacterium]|nr:RNase adapter RapZ [Oscillospiraceae bacterium]